VIQTNGSILIGGAFTHVINRARTGIARLDSSGGVEMAFNPSISGAFSTVLALALQGDGKIIVGGSFTNVNSTPRTNIARLNPDGTLDVGFKPVSVDGGQYSSAAFYALALDAQGRVLAGGDFTNVNGVVRSNIVRFNGDGSLDTNFNAAAGTDLPLFSVVVQYDGRVLLGGDFNRVNGALQNYLARLNASGGLDPSFNTGSGASDSVYAIALQSDGKVLAGGGFAEFNGAASSGIARLLNPPPLFNPVLSNTTFKVSVATLVGKSYNLEFKNALADSMWTSLPAVIGDGTVKTLIDGSATVAQRFYRVELQ
jgi:uncharacterized delta-60 repeat protein